MACPKPCNKSPFSAFTMPLYLVFRGRWPDLAYGISGVWALGPKLIFQDWTNHGENIRLIPSEGHSTKPSMLSRSSKATET
jgi:hypothetical protein